MNAPNQSLSDAALDLGFAPFDARRFFGRYRQYTIAMTAISGITRDAVADDPEMHEFVSDDQTAVGVVFQIRYAYAYPDPRTATHIAWPASIKKLLTLKAAEFEVGDRIAWLTIYDTRVAETLGGLQAWLDCTLDTLQAAGLQPDGNGCVECGAAPSLTSIFEGQVSRLCSACIGQQAVNRRDRHWGTRSGAIRTVCAGLGTAPVSAALWFGVWWAYDAIWSWITRGPEAPIVFLPNLILVGLLLATGFLIGAPVGYCLRGRSESGEYTTAVVAVVCTIVIVILGDWSYVTYLAHRESGVFSPVEALELLPTFWISSGVIGVLMRFALAAATVAGIVTIAGNKSKRSSNKIPSPADSKPRSMYHSR